MNGTTLGIIAAGALVTYFTRIGGHLLMSRFHRIHPRIEAGLDAVPAAVLTTLVAPAVANGGPIEWAAMAGAILVAWRGGLIATFLAGAVILILLRNLFV